MIIEFSLFALMFALVMVIWIIGIVKQYMVSTTSGIFALALVMVTEGITQDGVTIPIDPFFRVLLALLSGMLILMPIFLSKN